MPPLAIALFYLVEKGTQGERGLVQKQSRSLRPKRKSFPINKREKERKERKTNKRIEEKQQLKPLKTEQQIKLSNRGYR